MGAPVTTVGVKWGEYHQPTKLRSNKMARHFGPQHVKNGYAAMGNALGRPIYKGINSQKTIAEAIALERERAKRQANIKATKPVKLK
jgi:hypothetical protein